MTDPEGVSSMLSLAIAGDRDGLGRLWERCRPYLAHLARRRLEGARQSESGSDVLQETYLKVQAGITTFCGTTEPQFLAWVTRILHNTAIDRLRRFNASPVVVQAVRNETTTMWFDCPAEQSTPSQRIVKEECLVALFTAIERLPDDQRRAVELRHLEGRSLQEIAEAMQRTPVAVAGLIKRGLSGLRNSLDSGWVKS